MRDAFEAYGEVDSIKIIIDKLTNRSKGFGFVEIHDEEEALVAIEGLNESELDGRNNSCQKSSTQKLSTSKQRRRRP